MRLKSKHILLASGALLIGGFAVMVAPYTPLAFQIIDGCGSGYSDFSPSQDGDKAVIAKWVDCGATTRRSSTYYLVPSRDKTIDNLNFKEIKPRNAFLKTDNPLSMRWENDDNLVVIIKRQYNSNLLKNKVSDVNIISEYD